MDKKVTIIQSDTKIPISSRVFDGTKRTFNSAADRLFRRVIRKPGLKWLQNKKRFKLFLSTKPFKYHEADFSVKVTGQAILGACQSGTTQAIGEIPSGTKRIYAYVDRPKEF